MKPINTSIRIQSARLELESRWANPSTDTFHRQGQTPSPVPDLNSNNYVAKSTPPELAPPVRSAGPFSISFASLTVSPFLRVYL